MRVKVAYLLAACMVAALSAAGAIQAQRYPTKSVRLILPFPPGGSTDILGRIAADALSRAWNVPVIADNRAGATGNIGAALCAKSPSDGYTLCMLTVAQSIAPSIYPDLPFDPLKDFSHVTLLATLPSLLVAHATVPVKNVREMIAYAKSRPGALNYASTGNGSGSQLMMEMLKLRTGTHLVHIPYKGAGPAMVDQLSGQVHISFSAAISTMPFLNQGKLVAIAVSTRDRFPPLPDLPTVDESGIKGFDGAAWQGMSMPAGVPRAIVNRINADLVNALKSPAMKEQIIGMGGMVAANLPAEFTAFIRTEIGKWATVAKAANVKGD
jgi:tripartite-type tricarboxylate transporter receptor subunit TctC